MTGVLYKLQSVLWRSPAPRRASWRGRAIRYKVASKRGQRTRLRGLCRARATSLRSNNLFCRPTNHAQQKGFPL
ncbi:MAG: hypothetical protein LBQ31_02665 [Bacteroidales bacterium]|nr:hypothetical protein [Bacteroidales bacterium]